MEKIKVIIKEPGKEMKTTFIKNELKIFQKLVSGYIETVRLFDNKKIVMVLNDVGKLIGLTPNFNWKDDVIVGTAIFTKKDGYGNLKSLNDEDLKEIKNYLLKGVVYV